MNDGLCMKNTPNAPIAMSLIVYDEFSPRRRSGRVPQSALSAAISGSRITHSVNHSSLPRGIPGCPGHNENCWYAAATIAGEGDIKVTTTSRNVADRGARVAL